MVVACRLSMASTAVPLALLLLSVRPVAAGVPWSDPSLMVISIGTAGLPSPGAARTPVPETSPVSHTPASRPSALVPLYISFAALQGLDAATTIKALDHGAVEANALMGGVAGNPAALVATKIGMTTATMWLTERLWRRDRTAAVVVMSLLNGMYAAVVAHNWRVAR